MKEHIQISSVIHGARIGENESKLLADVLWVRRRAHTSLMPRFEGNTKKKSKRTRVNPANHADPKPTCNAREKAVSRTGDLTDMLQVVHYRDPLPCALRVCIEENVPCIVSTTGREYAIEANYEDMK